MRRTWRSERGVALLMVLGMMVLLLAFLSQSLQAYMVLRHQNRAMAQELQSRATEMAARVVNAE